MNPFLKPIRQNVQQTDILQGYNHNLRIQDGEFYDMENMSSDLSPVLSPRGPRGLFKEGGDYQGISIKGVTGAVGKSTQPMYVDGEDLYIGPRRYPMGLSISNEPKTIITMGNRVVVFPDKKILDPAKTKVEKIDNKFSAGNQIVYMDQCRYDGTVIHVDFALETAPPSPKDGAYWLDLSGDSRVLKQFSESTGVWVTITSPYVKLSCPGIGTGFKKFDGIKIESKHDPDVNPKYYLDGYNIIWDIAPDNSYIIIVGVKPSSGTPLEAVITRESPDMDFVFESGNRLWGCKYRGTSVVNNNVEPANIIYASCPGDPTNWTRYMGQADDSYFSEVGSEGAFTGGIDYKGQPIFFKENTIHKVYGKYPPYSIQEISARGVQQDCIGSLAIADEVLYYKSRGGVCAYDGSLPRSIANPFGQIDYNKAVGAARNGKYYISMEDEDGKRSLFVYDSKNGLWVREDDLNVFDMAAGNYNIYAIDRTGKKIITLESGQNGDGLSAYEGPIHWSATTGDLALDDPRHKYISRLSIRMEIDACSQVEFYVRYDGAREWEFVCAQRGSRLQTVTVPIRPRRCDHMQVLIKGIGPAKIYGFTKTIQEGSDFT